MAVSALGVNPNSDVGPTGTGVGSVGENHANVHTHVLSDNVIGFKIVKAGSATLPGSGSPAQVAVTFDTVLPTAVTNYQVMLTVNSAVAAGAAGGAAVSAFTTGGFTITGPNNSSAVVNWIVVQVK